MAFFEQINLIDATTLYSNTSVTAAFTSTAIDTTNYGSIVVEVDSTSGQIINAIIEGSNDNTDGWYAILLNPTQDLSVTDVITGEGHYTFASQAKYIRVNVTQVTGTYTINVVGRSGPGPNAAEKLTAAFSPNTPLNVNIASGVLLDSNKAIILSDGIQYPIRINQLNQVIIIDCTGYSSFSYTNPISGGNVTLTRSNDGINFVADFAFSPNYAQTGSQTLGGNPLYLWTGPIQSRYLRFTYSSGTINGILVLKQAPWTSVGYSGYGQSFNIAAVGGGQIGATGLPVVGFFGANAQASISPVTIGGQYFDGSSATPYIKTLQTDTVGRLLISTGGYQIPGGNNQTTGSVVAIAGSNPGANSVTAGTAIPGMSTPGSNPYNVNTTLTQDTAQFEGQSQIELLAQILLELRIMNQQMYELPRLIASGQSSTDPPELMRVEPSIFTI